MTALTFATQELIAARRYTQDLPDRKPRDLWFASPKGVQAHIAWQVGHLAMAEFRLCIYCVCPVFDDDRAVIADDFMAHCRSRTRPVTDAVAYPSIDDTLRAFHDIHEHRRVH